MYSKASSERSGKVWKHSVTYKVDAEMTDENITSAVGYFISPDRLHQELSGTTQTLEDDLSGNQYSIFVSESHFSFSSYKNVKVLI